MNFFNVESVKAYIMNSSKRQTTPWTKSRKKPGPKKKEKGVHFDESKKKELAASDKGSWFNQPSSDVSGVSRVSHPSTSREVGASSLRLMASKAFTSGLAESDSTSGDKSNGSTESEELECEDEPNTWTVVDQLKINSKLQEIASCRFCGSTATAKLPSNSMGYFCCEPFGGSEPCVSLVGGMTQLTTALMRCDKLSKL